jgi:hypothetical protein
MFDKQLVQFDISIVGAMISKRHLNRLGLRFDDNIVASEEYCLFMQLAVHSDFCVMNEALAKYRVHGQSLTGKAIGKWAEEREYTLNRIKEGNPGIEKKYPTEFAEAYGRANYYRARYWMNQSDRKAARAALRKSAFVSAKYLGLYGISLLPASVWKFVHREDIKRRLTRLLNVARYAS